MFIEEEEKISTLTSRTSHGSFLERIQIFQLVFGLNNKIHVRLFPVSMQYTLLPVADLREPVQEPFSLEIS